MNDQNTETANSTKTLIQTKNTRATVCRSTPSVEQQPEDRQVDDEEVIDERDEAPARQPRHQRAVDRHGGEHDDEGGGEKPLQVPHAARDAHLVAQRPQDVIAPRAGRRSTRTTKAARAPPRARTATTRLSKLTV